MSVPPCLGKPQADDRICFFCNLDHPEIALACQEEVAKKERFAKAVEDFVKKCPHRIDAFDSGYYNGCLFYTDLTQPEPFDYKLCMARSCPKFLETQNK
ncbi:MAG: hypothetical protein ACM3UU_00820 [Ignavibacteriales bacterium]